MSVSYSTWVDVRRGHTHQWRDALYEPTMSARKDSTTVGICWPTHLRLECAQHIGLPLGVLALHR